ncbi:hypothetical protein [Breoghania sp.]|nr:hypothetical protein [Breoghania sp.]MDJ0929598.1 hypothetical protein [Breoghania sp.]
MNELIELPRAASLGLSFRAIQSSDQDFLRNLYASTRVDEMALVFW